MEPPEANRPGAHPPERGALGRDILRYVPGTLGPAVGVLVFAAVFTRVFDAPAYGRYNLVYSVALLIGALAGQWLVQSINRFVAASGNLAGHTELIGAGLSAIALTVVAAGIAVGAPLRQGLPREWQPFVLPGALLVLAWSLYQPLLATYQATLRAGANSALRVVQVGLRLGIALVVVLGVWRHSAALVLAAALAAGLPALWMWARLRAPFRLLPLARSRREGLARWVRYGFPLVIWVACDVLLAVGDRYVIQWLRGPSEVGIYAANYAIVAGGAGLLAAPIRLAAHPLLMRAWGRGEAEVAAAWLGRILSAMVFALIAVVGPAVIFAPDLAGLVLGSAFREGYLVMPIAMTGIALWQLGLYLHKPFEFHERTGAMMAIAAAAVTANLALNVLFVPVWGYLAAAWTTVASYGLYAALTGVLGRRLLRWRIEWRTLAAPTAALLAALAALAGLRWWLADRVDYPVELAISGAGLALILAAAAVRLAEMLRAPAADVPDGQPESGTAP